MCSHFVDAVAPFIKKIIINHKNHTKSAFCFIWHANNIILQKQKTPSMKTYTLFHLFPLVFTLSILFSSCDEKDPIITEPTLVLVDGFPEGFESGSKSSYAPGTVDVQTGSWYFDDAVIGTTPEDRKNGSKSARIREQGKVTMLFSVQAPIYEVDISVGSYGSDGIVSWELWYSTDNGTNWEVLSEPVNTSSTTLETLAFDVNIPDGEVRFQVRNTSLADNRRLNIDDFAIYTEEGNTTVPVNNPRDDNAALGNPSSATSDISNENNYLMLKTQYTLSYNRSKGTANWVSWHLSNGWLGDAERQDDFRVDDGLPAGWYQVNQYSFSGSGFDRGHICPSADRTTSIADNSATFFMTNMMPQAPNNNQGLWANLESYCRTLVSQGNELYIVAGPRGQGGQGSNGGITQKLDNNRVVVPSNTWKAIVVLPNGNTDLSRISNQTRVIAVDMPNTQSVGSSWGNYRISVDELENLTGFDLFDLIPASIQDQIESQVDNGPTN